MTGRKGSQPATYWFYWNKFHSRTHLVIYDIVIGLVRTSSDFGEGDPTNVRPNNWKKQKEDLTLNNFHLIFKSFSKI